MVLVAWSRRAGVAESAGALCTRRPTGTALAWTTSLRSIAAQPERSDELLQPGVVGAVERELSTPCRRDDRRGTVGRQRHEDVAARCSERAEAVQLWTWQTRTVRDPYRAVLHRVHRSLRGHNAIVEAAVLPHG